MASSQTTHDEWVIQAHHGWRGLNLGEVWRYRHMVYLLMWRNITVGYKQSILGPFWLIINNIFLVVVNTLIFGVIADIDTGEVAYPLFNFIGIIPMTLFTSLLGSSTASALNNRAFIEKIYVPRLAFPIIGMSGGLMGLFSLACCCLLCWFSTSTR
ncbi:MAG: hypothetical protein HC915_01355 [Anaerolineae bacterium]|nr:hypothetical protein [Anaerolineae bacterium]